MDIGEIRIFYIIFSLTEEIIYLLTGEEYTLVKKTSGHLVTPTRYICGSGRWSRTQSDISLPQPHMLVYDRNNAQKILDLTYKMIELLTGEVPIRSQDVAVYFSMEEWEYIEGHKDLYKDVTMGDHQPLTSPDGSCKRNASEGCTSAFCSQDCLKENHSLCHDHQGEDVMSVKVGEQYKKGGPSISAGSYCSKSFQFSVTHSDLHKSGVPFRSDPSSVNRSQELMTERILNLSLEIIYLLTQENFTVVKKTALECVIPGRCYRLSGGWGGTRNPVKEPPSGPLIQERHYEQKILDLTNTITELLTGEVLKRCQDVAVCFSMAEWEYIAGHKDLYQNVMMEDNWPLSPTAGSRRRNPTGIYPSREISQDCQEKNPPQDHQNEDFIYLKNNLIEGQKDLADISTVNHNKLMDEDLLSSPHFLEDIPSALHLRQRLHAHQLSESGYQEKPLPDNFASCTQSTQQKGGKLFPCPRCGKGFTRKFNLFRHEITHTGWRPFVCSKCGKSFTQEYLLVKHEIFHFKEKLYLCSECGKTFVKKSMYINHQSIHTGKKTYICQECGKCFFKKSVFVDHRRTHTGARPYPCLMCGKCFAKKSGRDKHNQTHTEEKPFSCLECGKRFSKKSVLGVHRRTHIREKLYRCLECGNHFNKKSGLDKHQQTHTGEKPYQCLDCGKCFFQKSGLIKHQRIHTRRKVVPCLECENGTCIYPEGHNGFHEERPFLCPKCGKRFTQKAYLVKHQKIHTGEKPFSCLECGKRFLQKDHLERHQRIHTGEKPFSCSECGRCFTQKKTLDQHHKVHTGEKPFSCPECWKCFTRKCQLEVHQRSHTGKKPSENGPSDTYEVVQRSDRNEQLFLCSECGNCFNRKSDLVAHQKTHKLKPFSCSECGKCFTRKSPLTMHLKTHTGEKPFSCSDCGKCFIQKSDLLRHHKIHTRAPKVSVLDGRHPLVT